MSTALLTALLAAPLTATARFASFASGLYENHCPLQCVRISLSALPVELGLSIRGRLRDWENNTSNFEEYGCIREPGATVS